MIRIKSYEVWQYVVVYMTEVSVMATRYAMIRSKFEDGYL